MESVDAILKTFPVDSWRRVPVLSTIGAARSFDDLPLEGWINIAVPPGAKASDRFCAGVVHGESLYDDSIHDGDVVVFRLTFDPCDIRPGSLAAVFTPYGLLLKHIYFTLNGKVRLVSANPVYEDLLLDADEVTVQGIACQVVRQL